MDGYCVIRKLKNLRISLSIVVHCQPMYENELITVIADMFVDTL